VIELTDVSKCFNAGKPNQYLAVENVSLTIRRGELTILKGPSGSGKTSLLSLVGCMGRPTSGRIRLRGIATDFLPNDGTEPVLDISSLPERFLTEIRRSAFGFIFQQFNLVRGITALENIMLPSYPTGERYAVFKARAEELLKTFGITRQGGSKVEWLSGGELQRVAIARALINDPAVIIADEPTAHLDSRLSREFMDMLGSFKRAGKTIILASHDPIACDHPLADRVVQMRDGRIVVGGND
jgi:putative ABC transport system ATP-binding protein